MALGLRDIFTHIVGVSHNPNHVMETLNLGIVDEFLPFEHAISNAHTIIVAIPVDATIRLLPRVLDMASEQAVVLDVGSTKGTICNSIRKHARRLQFVATHPMAGGEAAGPMAANLHLFRNRRVIICDREQSSSEALSTVKSIYETLGMKIMYMSAQEHDANVALISHLPQVLSYCLAALDTYDEPECKQALELAASGYDSTTRLAASPAKMWLPIFDHNKENIANAIDSIISTLDTFKKLLSTDSQEEIKRLIEKANERRKEFLGIYGGMRT